MQLRSIADGKDFENHHIVHKFQTENTLLVIRKDAQNPCLFFLQTIKKYLFKNIDISIALLYIRRIDTIFSVL